MKVSGFFGDAGFIRGLASVVFESDIDSFMQII